MALTIETSLHAKARLSLFLLGNPFACHVVRSLFIVHVVALLVIKYDLCTLVQIGGLFQSYKLRGTYRGTDLRTVVYRGMEIRRGTHPYPGLSSL